MKNANKNNLAAQLPPVPTLDERSCAASVLIGTVTMDSEKMKELSEKAQRISDDAASLADAIHAIFDTEIKKKARIGVKVQEGK